MPSKVRRAAKQIPNVPKKVVQHDMEHHLAPYVAFLVMPIFAFFNAGVALGGQAGLVSAVSLGAFCGLLLGKPLGVVGFVWLAVRTGLSRMPQGSSWAAFTGIGLLAGIGFTMSLFITNLAFPEPAELDQAKLGVLAASVIAALAGLGFLHYALGSRDQRRPAEATAGSGSAD